jgi:hypothetical protein
MSQCSIKLLGGLSICMTRGSFWTVLSFSDTFHYFVCTCTLQLFIIPLVFR